MSDKIFNNRYRIEKKIGEGGMAVVYSGTDVLLRRRVAVKVLREQYAADEDFVRRFYYEAQAAARLSHPNIVNTYDVGREGDTYFIVMELIDGSTLGELIATEHRLPEGVAIDYATQILQGLAYAHRQGLLHRDIKPANILITSDDVVKLSDFGIARAVSQHSLSVTQPGMVMGSVYYLSPEQAQGHDLSETSDLYSVGIVLYQMLTGKLPYTGESPITVALKHVSGKLPELDPEQLQVSPALLSIVRRLLQKDPGDRYASASDVARALREAREHPTVALGGRGLRDEGATVTIPVVSTPPPRRSQAPDRPRNGQAAAVTTLDPDIYDDDDRRRGTPPYMWFALIVLLIVAAIGGFEVASKGGLPFGGAPTPVAVGNYVGQSASLAKQSLAGAGLAVKVTPTSSDSVPADRVVRQVPDAGATIDSKGTVELFVSTGLPLVDVPSVKSYTAADAQKLLSAGRFVTKQVARYDKAPKDTVIDQQPPAGKKLRQGGVVTLIVSKGQAPIAVPNVVSMNVDQARAALTKAGLTLQVGQTAPSDNIPPNTVASQDPKDGTQVDPGSAVTVSVSSGPGLGDVPDVTGKNMSEASSAVRAAGFDVSYSWRVVAGADGNVIQQTPGPPARAHKGSGITIVIGVPGTVPDVSNMTLADAKTALINAGYAIGNIALTQDGKEGMVVRTEPEAGTQLRPGDNNAVTIYFNQSSPR